MEHEGSLLQRLFGLAGQTALVTGASGGLGRAIALTLAQAGARVGLHGTREAQLQAIRSEIEALGGEAAVLVADLRNPDACRRLIADAHAVLGRLDILVNNAGLNRRKPIVEVTDEDFEIVVAVNLRGVFVLSQAAHAFMRAQGGGKIINIGSMTTFEGLGDVSVYGATKAAVGQLTKTMAVEWARDNIQVNCIAPGFMLTPLTEVPIWGDPHRSRWLHERIPARRPGMPDDLAGAVLLLAAPASSYITGHTLVVDGGHLAGGSWARYDE